MDRRFNQPLQLELNITVSGATVGRIAELLAAMASAQEQPKSLEAATTPLQRNELVLDRTQTAKLLKVSGSTLSRMVRNRQMPQPIRFGQAVRWCRDEIEAWVNAGCPSMSSWNYQPKQKNV